MSLRRILTAYGWIHTGALNPINLRVVQASLPISPSRSACWKVLYVFKKSRAIKFKIIVAGQSMTIMCQMFKLSEKPPVLSTNFQEVTPTCSAFDVVVFVTFFTFFTFFTFVTFFTPVAFGTFSFPRNFQQMHIQAWWKRYWNGSHHTKQFDGAIELYESVYVISRGIHFSAPCRRIPRPPWYSDFPMFTDSAWFFDIFRSSPWASWATGWSGCLSLRASASDQPSSSSNLL